MYFTRKHVLVLTIFSFVAAAAGLTLALHLAGHEHPHKHDSEHCQICQQLLSISDNVIMTPDNIIVCADQVGYSIEFTCQTPLATYNPKYFDPRSPPSSFV